MLCLNSWGCGKREFGGVGGYRGVWGTDEGRGWWSRPLSGSARFCFRGDWAGRG